MYTFEYGGKSGAAEMMKVIRAVIDSGYDHWDDEYPTIDILEADARHGGLLLAREDGEVVAGISIVFSKRLLDELNSPQLGFTQCKSSMLARLCVLPRLQHTGLGTELMRRAIEAATERGVASARLLAAADNDGANRLYRRLGFTLTGADSPFDDEVYNAYEMML